MLEYIVLIALPCLYLGANKLADAQKKVAKKTLLIFFVLFLALLCFRDFSVGIDLSNYIQELESAKKLPWAHVFELEGEWGWFIYKKLFVSLFSDPRLFIILCAFLTVVPISLVYYKEAENPLIVIALFVTVAPFTMIFSGLRQSIAMAIGVLAFSSIKNKKFIRYILCVAIAFCFHTSAFVLLFMPLYFLKLNKKSIWVVAVLALIIFIFRAEIFTLLVGLLPESYQESGTLTDTGAYRTLVLLLIFVVYSFIIPSDKLLNNEDYGLRTLMALSVIFQIFATINQLAMRFNYYFLLLIPITMSRIVNRATKENEGLVLLSIFVIVTTMFSYFIINGYIGEDILHVFPYIWGI